MFLFTILKNVSFANIAVQEFGLISSMLLPTINSGA